METPEEVVGHKDVANINVIKGKRTKRQRPQSPIPFTIATHLSSGNGVYGSNGDHNNNNDDDNSNNNSSSSPASSDEFAISTTTEDEDTAKLLILLAQGRSREYSSAKDNNDHHHDQDYYIGTPVKFNSKRYIETSSTGNGKTGMYVYECKTCNRTFPSFQALGGHRASHKKPKNMAAAEAKKQYSFAFSDEDEGFFKNNNNNNNNLSPLSYQLGNVNNMSNKYSSSPKIHECSYCGAEFTSGQALGGHMRRHRGSNVVANTALSLSPLSPLSVNQDSEEAKNKLRNNGVSLSLDLNLPAPEDDHNKFSFAIKQQQQQQKEQEQQEEKKETTLVLSTTPTLVDCHY